MKLETVDVDCLVIGAGVAGLAVAREISSFYSDVVIVEKNNIIGGEVSSRNSEVIHAGLYYTQGSLKHKLMIDGKERIYQFLKDRNIPYRRCGKYIISVNDSETERLRAISSNAKACGVMDTFFDTETFKIRYPFIRVNEAMFSPSTGIIDSHSYMEALKDEFEMNGGHVLLNNSVTEVNFKSGFVEVLVSDKNSNTQFIVRSPIAINCAGLNAPDIHNLIAGQDEAVSPRYVKGDYYSYGGKESIEHLIYPIPEQDGLGVHVTMDLGGQVKFGPSAYSVNEIDYGVDASGKEGFLKSIRAYWPGLNPDLLQPSYSGIRPKINGLDDFQIIKKELNGGIFMSVLGYESPGLSASLGLSAYVSRLLNE
jgi:L-2-hydroxyglutarate oxidase LhgO